MEFTMIIEYYDLIKNMWYSVHYENDTFEVTKKNVFITSVNESIYIVSISNLIIDLFLLCTTIIKINCILNL